MTYVAHAILALVLVAISALSLLMELGNLDFGSYQAYGTIIGMCSIVPLAASVLIAAYSAVAAIVSSVRRQAVPRDMVLLPLELVVLIGGGMALGSLDTLISKVGNHLLVAVYASLTFVLVARHRSGRRRAA